MWWLLLIIVYAAIPNAKELTYYADFERLNVLYWNPKYIEFMNASAKRYNRRDPIHYLNYHFKLLNDFGDDIMVNWYFYEFLSNEYRRSMVEMHYMFCDIFIDTKYKIFKPFVVRFYKGESCPIPKGEHHFMNFSIPNLPLLRTFPFRKGRVFGNFTNLRDERVLNLHVDATIKQRFL